MGIRGLVGGTVALVMMTACGGASHRAASQVAAAPSAATTTAAPVTSTTATTKEPAKDTAAGVAAKLKAAGLPITGLIVYDATTDPNHLLGRPNQYTSKAAWVDTRLKVDPNVKLDPGDVGLGGGVEVFPDATGARARADRIQSLTQAVPILGVEYDYLAGDTLVRVSGNLTPAQAADYGKAVGGTLDSGK